MAPEKDVDGLHPWNVGMVVRERRRSSQPRRTGSWSCCSGATSRSKGAEVVVVGYGDLVGAPLSIMLAQDSLRGNATVTITHAKTANLAAHTRRADILVAAAGVPKLVTGDMIKPGGTVIDVGVHRTDDGLVGDVDFDAGGRGRGRHHPRPRRRGTDDRRDAPREHGHRRRDAGLRRVSPTGGRRAGRLLDAGEFVRHRRGRAAPLGERAPRSRDAARGLVGYVDAVNVTDNPTASRPHVAGGGRPIRARGGRRADRSSSSAATGTGSRSRRTSSGLGARRSQRALPQRRPDDGRRPPRREAGRSTCRRTRWSRSRGRSATRGRPVAGAEIEDPPRYLIGVADVPLADPYDPAKLEAKLDAGADFVLDPDRVRHRSTRGVGRARPRPRGSSSG